MGRPRKILFCLLLLPSCYPAAAAAAQIHLRDGSLIIGTIEELNNGEDLTVDTEYMDDVVIDWDAIERIDGAAPVNVELFSGERIIGNLTLTDDGLYVGPDDERRELEPEQVFEIGEYTAGWLDGLGAYINLGMNLVRGNNRVTQITYGGGVSYDANRFETGLDTTLIVNEQTDAPNTERYTLRAFYDHKLTRRWSAGGIYQFESDEQQGLQGRSLFSGALGNSLINNRIQRLILFGGLALNSEDFEDTSPADSLEALAGLNYRLRTKWDLDFDSSLNVFPGLSESGRLRIQFDSTLSTDLIGDLDFNVIYYNRYDSDPPIATGNTDWGLTLALGYDF